MYEIALKSGTGRYYDPDGCDEVIAEVPSLNIPQVGDMIDLECKHEKVSRRTYLVREVKRSINIEPFAEWIYVYVIEL